MLRKWTALLMLALALTVLATIAAPTPAAATGSSCPVDPPSPPKVVWGPILVPQHLQFVYLVLNGPVAQIFTVKLHVFWSNGQYLSAWEHKLSFAANEKKWFSERWEIPLYDLAKITGVMGLHIGIYDAAGTCLQWSQEVDIPIAQLWGIDP